MKKLSLYERIHWAVFNVLAKLFAYALIGVSLVFIFMVAANVIGSPTGDELSPWLLLLHIPLLILGVMMARAKAYYPSKNKGWDES